MSAYIVDDQVINKVVTYLSMLKNSNYDAHIYRFLEKQGYDLSSNAGKEKLGQDMFKINVNAVNERYGENEAEKFRPLDYRFQLDISINAIQAYKSLKCWLYQCTEGEQPETAIYKIMDRVRDMLAGSIVSKLPAYEKAAW